jgi:O-antigen ligase
VKWVFLAILVAVVLPLAGWLRRNPRETPKIWMLMGFLPFGLGEFHLYMAAISWPQWPGYVKGVEITVLDMLALAMYLSLPRAGSTIPFRLSMALYFLAVVLAVLQSPVPIAAVFYPWQIARIFLVYAVVAKACADERVVPALLTGMTIGLCFEACYAAWERFGLGVLQAGGTLGHQNFLGLISHFVTFPLLALLLAGERGWPIIAGPVTGLVIAALTVSRGTIGLLGAGYIGIFALSALRRWTARKAVILVVGVASVCALGPVIMSSFEQRFNQAETSAGYDGGYDERAAFENAATSMLSDHPMGVGSNYYVVAANTGGYNTRAAVTWAAGSETANVHNVYYLVAAETGYIGLITFVLMLLRPLITAFRCGWRNRGDRRGDLLLGLGMSLLIVYIHSFFEWIFITFQAQYMFALDAGMVAGLATQLGYWRSPASKRLSIGRTTAPLTKVMRN